MSIKKILNNTDIAFRWAKSDIVKQQHKLEQYLKKVLKMPYLRLLFLASVPAM